VDAGAGYEMGRTDDLEVFGAVEDAGFDFCAGGGAGHGYLGDIENRNRLLWE